jgi:hypothetical protein
MAYINRLSDINNKLDTSIENQTETNSKLANIDDNIETIRTLNTTLNTSVAITNTNLDTVNENLISIDNNITTTNTKLDTINTSVGTTNTKLDTVNTKLDTVNTSIGTTNTTLTSTNTKLDTINTSIGTVNTSVGTVNTSIGTVNTSIGTTNTTLSTIDGKLTTTTNDYSTVGLNVYQILPKVKQYTFGGIDNNATAYRLIGGNSTSGNIAIDTMSFGLANPRVYYATTTIGTPNTNLYIDYIDNSGNLIEDAGPYAIVATLATTLPTMIGGPIKFRTSTTIGSIANSSHSVYISAINGGDTTRVLGHLSIANYGIAIFTIPSGYIGYITNITAAFSTAGSLLMVKWNSAGIRQIAYKCNVENTLNISISAGYDGMIGGIFTAGESIGFSHNLATTNKIVQASVLLRPI